MIILYERKKQQQQQNELLKWNRWSSNFFTNKKYYDRKSRYLNMMFSFVAGEVQVSHFPSF